jgi:hypothetical protein
MRNRFSLFATALCAFMLAAPCVFAAEISYTASTSDFPNPERGFFEQSYAYAVEQSAGQAYLPLSSDSNFIGMRARNRTVIWRLVSLQDFRGADTLPTSLISSLTTDFNAARTAGVKLYVRFAYTFNTQGAFNEVDITRTQGHIAQLGSVLTTHADVVTHLDAGMLGRYGEWYSDSNQITIAMRQQVIDAWLQALPVDRSITVRTPAYKQLRFGAVALTAGFDGTAAARVGHHNDCYLKSVSDLGTYSGDPAPRAAAKAYIAAETQFVPMSGETCGRFAIEPSFETCGMGEDCTTRSNCPTALSESAAHHWSLLNARYNTDLVGEPSGDWAVQGCLNDVRKRLGYRLELVSASLPDSAQVGSTCTWNARVRLRNVGFASPFNAREFDLVFEPVAGGALVRQSLRSASNGLSDPRRWLPELGSFELTLANLPSTLAPGSYRLYLALPDARATLATRADYAIQLANVGTWDANRGLNSLNHTLAVSACTQQEVIFRSGFES